MKNSFDKAEKEPFDVFAKGFPRDNETKRSHIITTSELSFSAQEVRATLELDTSALGPNFGLSVDLSATLNALPPDEAAEVRTLG